MINDAAQPESAPPTVAAAGRPADGQRAFDGVICFGGEDWWYHNRGHFDMRIMRELSAQVPVLYVNSIGMRTPAVREGRMFARRIARKLRSMKRGFVRVDERFGVVSPVVAPTGLGRVMTMPTLPMQVRRAAARLGISRPLIWIACPTAAEIVCGWPDAPLVYQRTDRFERFVDVNAERVARYDEYLKARADLTVFCSSLLLAEEAEMCGHACLLGHGVDYQRFADAGAGLVDEPADMGELPRPRAGFIGSIDAHTFDPTLMCDVARRLPDVQFPLIGGCTLPERWCDEPNITMLGRRPYEQVHQYMAACDVLIMPWARNRWIEACNPVKLKEYLAIGRPVVSTSFPELKRFGDLVATADDAAGFAGAIRAALAAPPEDAARRRAAVRGETWSSKCAALLRRLRVLGLVPRTEQPTAVPDAEKPSGRSTARAAAPGSSAAPVIEPKVDISSLTGPADLVGPERPAPALSSDAPQPINPFRALREHSGRREVVAATDDALPVTAPSAVILLAGGAQPSALVEASGCSVLDLWLTPQRRLLDCWVEALGSIPGVHDGRTAMRVISSASSPPPWPRPVAGVDLAYEQEPKRYRGIAGLLHDVCRAQGWDGHLLIAEAARLAVGDLLPLWQRHVRSGADVTVACDRMGVPAGVYAVRCRCFERVPSIGYTDLKEQLLQSSGLDVRGWALNGWSTMPLRSGDDFLRAASLLNGQPLAGPGRSGQLDGRAGVYTSGGRYGLVMTAGGVEISASATIIDSVLMPGCVVGANACVVRSVLVGGTRIQEGADIADVVAGPRAVVPGRAGCAAV